MMRLISSGSGKSRRKPPQTTSCLTAADRRRVFPHRIITNWKKACPRYNPATQPPVTPLVLDSKQCAEALASARTQSSRSKFGPKRVNSKKVATRTQRKSPIWRKKRECRYLAKLLKINVRKIQHIFEYHCQNLRTARKSYQLYYTVDHSKFPICSTVDGEF